MAFNVQKQARRTSKAVIAATTHTDLFEDLAPSVHIHKGWGERLRVGYRNMLSDELGLKRVLNLLVDSVGSPKFSWNRLQENDLMPALYVIKRSNIAFHWESLSGLFRE